MLSPSWSRWFWHLLGYWFFVLFFLFFYSYRWFGRHRIPKKGPVLIIANHESFWDPPLVGCAVGRRTTFMARKTLFDHKLMGGMIRRVGAFPVDQEGTGLDGMRTAVQKFKEGEVVVIFPEGTRTDDGTLHSFMPGIALLIRRAKVPVVPVGLAGVYDAWPIHAKKPRFAPLWRGARKESLAAVVGTLIPAETLLAMEPGRMVEYLQNAVAQVREEAYRRKRLPCIPR